MALLITDQRILLRGLGPPRGQLESAQHPRGNSDMDCGVGDPEVTQGAAWGHTSYIINLEEVYKSQRLPKINRERFFGQIAQ